MKRKKVDSKSTVTLRTRPDMTAEARNNVIIAAAMEEAERRILDGTASDGLLQHFLKLGTPQARLDERKTEAEVLKLEAQAENFKSTANREQTQKEAIAAFTRYATGREIDPDSVVLIDD